MTDEKRSGDKPRAVGVPRRFAVGTALIIVTMYSVLFGWLKWLGVSPLVFTIVAVFVTCVAAARCSCFAAGDPATPRTWPGACCFR